MLMHPYLSIHCVPPARQLNQSIPILPRPSRCVHGGTSILPHQSEHLHPEMSIKAPPSNYIHPTTSIPLCPWGHRVQALLLQLGWRFLHSLVVVLLMLSATGPC